MNMKRVRSAVLAAALTCSMTVTPVLAAPTTDTGKLQSQKEAAQNEVNNLQSQLSTLLTKMNDLQNQLIQKGQEISEAQKELEETEAKEEQQRQDMILRIRYMYEEGNGSALEKVLESGSIAEMLTQAEYAQKIHQYDRKQLEEYVATVNQITELKKTLEEEQANLEQTAASYESQQVELNTIITEKSAEVANLDEQIKEAAAEAARKAAEEAKRAQEQAAAAAANQNRGTSSASNTNNTSNAGNTNNSSNTNGGTPAQEDTSSADTTPTPTPTPAPEPTPDTTDTSSIRQTIVNAAYSQIGVPYVWGGSSPGVGLDCSGLTQYCYSVAGISIPRTDITQLNAGTITNNPQPGDICWTSGHVAIYIGNGQMIEAQQPGTTICVSPVRVTYYVTFL